MTPNGTASTETIQALDGLRLAVEDLFPSATSWVLMTDKQHADLRKSLTSPAAYWNEKQRAYSTACLFLGAYPVRGK